MHGQPNQDTTKTLKKDFQPRNLKNYKNMIKYGCNQNEFDGSYQFQAIPKIDAQGNTPPLSTADTSLITNKLSSIAAGNCQINKKDPNAWFK